MSGMNPGFAAYLANKKAGKSAAPAPSMGAPLPSAPMAGMMPLMAQPMPGAPKGKRHAKIMHVSTAHKKGK